MKKDYGILIVSLLIIFTSFFVYHYNVETKSFSDTKAMLDITGKSLVDSRAVQANLAMSITIICIQHEINSTSSGNVSFNSCTNNVIKSVYMYNATYNITVFNNVFPTGWSEPQPTTNEVKSVLIIWN